MHTLECSRLVVTDVVCVVDVIVDAGKQFSTDAMSCINQVASFIKVVSDQVRSCLKIVETVSF
jgi:hypothetical protein